MYGSAPLALGQPAIVTAQMRTAPAQGERSSLQAPNGIAVETLPVRSFADRQVSWRLRPSEPVRGTLRLTIGGLTVEKTISAGERGLFLPVQKSRSLLNWLLHPGEGRLPQGDVEWVEVGYPKADVALAGIALSWVAWFLIISTASALVFARWLRVPS